MRVAKQVWASRIWLQRLAMGVGGLLVLLVLAGFALTQLVDPNLYRGLIERQVSAATGRAFRLTGDIELAFFPWLSLTTGAGELPSPAGFPERRFLRWQKAHVGARLLPLLHGELVVDRVRLVGLDARLVRAADGRVNWTLDSGTAGDAAPGPRPDIAGIELRDSRLTYEDASSSTHLDDLRLDIEPIRDGVPMRIELAATMSRTGVAERVTVNAATVMTLGPSISLADTTIAGKLLGARLGSGGVPWHFKAPQLRFGSDSSLALPAWELQFNDAVLRGATTARFGDTLVAAGTLSLSPVSLRETLAAVGVELPPTRDPGAFGRAKLTAGFKVDGDSFVVDPFDVILDDTHLTGRVTREAGTLHFALRADAVDLDRYLKPDGAPSEPFVFPTAALKALRAEGTLDIDEATLEGVRMKGVRLGAGP